MAPAIVQQVTNLAFTTGNVYLFLIT